MRDASTVSIWRRDNYLICKKLKHRYVNEPVVQYNGTATDLQTPGHKQD